MDWLTGVRGRVVALDTAPLIYFIEEHPTYLPLVRPFFEGLDRGDFQVVTSTITLLEVLVQPLRSGDTVLQRRYRDILLGVDGLSIVAVSPAIAEEAARVRAAYNLSPPDAIQLATAIVTGAAALLTNDTRLPRRAGVPIIVLDEL